MVAALHPATLSVRGWLQSVTGMWTSFVCCTTPPADIYYTAQDLVATLPGIGNDPVFNPKSSLYNKDIVMEIDKW